MITNSIIVFLGVCLIASLSIVYKQRKTMIYTIDTFKQISDVIEIKDDLIKSQSTVIVGYSDIIDELYVLLKEVCNKDDIDIDDVIDKKSINEIKTLRQHYTKSDTVSNYSILKKCNVVEIDYNIDVILDKIREFGMESLTKDEFDFLQTFQN